MPWDPAQWREAENARRDSSSGLFVWTNKAKAGLHGATAGQECSVYSALTNEDVNSLKALMQKPPTTASAPSVAELYGMYARMNVRAYEIAKRGLLATHFS